MPCSSHKGRQRAGMSQWVFLTIQVTEPQEHNQLLSKQPIPIPHRPSYRETNVTTIVFDSSSGFYEDTVKKEFTCIPPWGYINRYCGSHWQQGRRLHKRTRRDSMVLQVPHSYSWILEHGLPLCWPSSLASALVFWRGCWSCASSQIPFPNLSWWHSWSQPSLHSNAGHP
jgi:hypothetical protein